MKNFFNNRNLLWICLVINAIAVVLWIPALFMGNLFGLFWVPYSCAAIYLCGKPLLEK